MAAFNADGLVAYESIASVNLAYSDKNAAINKTILISNATAGANTLLSNYNLSYVHSNSGVITAKDIIIAATAQNKIYDGNTSVANSSAYTVSGLIANESVIGVKLDYADKNAGINKTILISNATAGANTLLSNYNVSYVGSNSGAITAKDLIITATAQNKIYDGNTSVANSSAYTVSGLIDNESLIGVKLDYADKNAGNNKTIIVSNVTVGTNTLLSNYNITYLNDNSSSITQLKLKSATGISVINKKYDGNTIASLNFDTASFPEVLVGDSVKIAGASGVFDNASIGINKLVTISKITLSGINASNYDAQDLYASAYGNITSSNNSSISFSSIYNSNIKNNLLSNYNIQYFNYQSSYSDILGISTYNDYILQKKSSSNFDQKIEIKQSGVNQNVR